MARFGLRLFGLGSLSVLVIIACADAPPPSHAAARPAIPPAPPKAKAVELDAGHIVDSGVEDAAPEAAPPTFSRDPMDLHQTTREGLLALFSIKEGLEGPTTTAFLENTFGTESARKMNQGNKAIARHLIDKEKCLSGLRTNNVVLQTAKQRQQCGGLENMVPIWEKGQKPSFCIDVFEFPNKACELPMVWTPPAQAKKVCELEGKRLCADTEWNLACRGDPEGGADQRYAYGDKLDLDICHTNLPHRTSCVARGPSTAWETCSTDTEPSGSFPRCRSRFGVFDQHGNVAEVMTRREGKDVVTQLKGSAWFYVELAKEPGKPPLSSTVFKDTAYPDHCNFDPRWHVEPLAQGVHTNYHLGFRCCRSVDSTGD